MPVALVDLVAAMDELLEPGRFRDYCPNGLQVGGRATVARLACAVTANQSVLDDALAWGADALLVHHGYFWRGEDPRVVGMKQRRLATLLGSGLSLIAYHLPLDAHPAVGNNAELGRRLAMVDVEPLHRDPADGVGAIGNLPEPLTAASLAERLTALTGREPLHIGDGAALLRRVAWCTGAAQGYIDAAVAAGADAYITGEVSEPTVHSAREQGIQFFAAGHHATERYGVQALGEVMAGRFGLELTFLDCDNPV
ncbi:Nif3-like dinuclear metal center hexameric protein [Pseudohaliea rubra]|uniref:GTP cyclohydrolase 1 type 2 homolog n=1 Tax=Pseudohaliea rubra DSM 19751 TaxID=1265313 RepID=A0A095VPD2_9GAMM|nr:Nif3-like dinuclear metal center hexameric protein [Pseudohaliea rubra]KGE03235.1 hypothetical protein HRUBRA_02183 [Pseudohaliea rubra DSM 19751]